METGFIGLGSSLISMGYYLWREEAVIIFHCMLNREPCSLNDWFQNCLQIILVKISESYIKRCACGEETCREEEVYLSRKEERVGHENSTLYTCVKLSKSKFSQSKDII